MESLLTLRCPDNSDYIPKVHEFTSHIVTAKARVTPLDVLTIPRSEMTSLQLCTRLQYKGVATLFQVRAV